MEKPGRNSSNSRSETAQKDEKEENGDTTKGKEELTCRGIPELHGSISMPARTREAGRGNDQCALCGAFMS